VEGSDRSSGAPLLARNDQQRDSGETVRPLGVIVEQSEEPVVIDPLLSRQRERPLLVDRAESFVCLLDGGTLNAEACAAARALDGHALRERKEVTLNVAHVPVTIWAGARYHKAEDEFGA
jgi:hypothetical protein